MEIDALESEHEIFQGNKISKAVVAQQIKKGVNDNENQEEKVKYPGGNHQNSLKAEMVRVDSRGNDSIIGISNSNLNSEGVKFKDAKKVVKFSNDILSDDTLEGIASFTPSYRCNSDMDDEYSTSSETSISISGLDLEEEVEYSFMTKTVQYKDFISRASTDEQKQNTLSLKSTPCLTMGIAGEFESIQDFQKMKSMSFLSSKIERSQGSFENLIQLVSKNSSWRPRSNINLFDDLEDSYME